MDLRPYSKAIAAAIAGALVMLLAKTNIVITDELTDAVEVVIGLIITGGLVYLAPANTPVEPGTRSKG